MMRRAGFGATDVRIGKLLVGLLLALAASLALAAAVGAQTPPGDGDSGPGTNQGPGGNGGNGDGGTGDGGNGGTGDGGDGGTGDGGTGDGGDGGTGDGGTGDGGDGGTGDGDSGDDEPVDPAEAAIAACASRYGGYNEGWPEQTCRYPGIIWEQRTSCAVNMVYSKRATGRTRQFLGGSWIMTERVEDYLCTTVWHLGGNPSPIPDDDLIRPTPPQLSLSIKYRIIQWELTTQTGRVHSEETHRERVLDDDDGDSGSGDGGSGSGSGGSGSGGSGSGNGGSGSGSGGSGSGGSGSGNGGSGSGSGN